MEREKKPNILVLWGEGPGDGATARHMPSLDRIADEGLRLTDYYGQHSRVAARAAFITGQSPLRTGLAEGSPGAGLGLQPKDPTIAELLAPLGYVSGRFGDDLGERDWFLTSRGFDELILRMQPSGVEVTSAATSFIRRAVAGGRPFFVWWSSSGQRDELVGRFLDELDELGIAEDTLVLYTTDSGHRRGKEGAFRVPALVRWPGTIPSGKVLDGIVSHLDWLPTFLAAAGMRDVTRRLLRGHRAGDKTFVAHLDGYDMLPYLVGEADQSPRREHFYVDDTGRLVALRYEDWKVVFLDWRGGAFEPLLVPEIVNLRHAPAELKDENPETYWLLDHAAVLIAAQACVTKMIETLSSFPPRRESTAFDLGRVADRLSEGGARAH